MKRGFCLLLLLALIYPSSQFTSDETCDLCKAVLRGVHGYFASSTGGPSKRVLARQLKHHCNRHFNVSVSQLDENIELYRRRCLVLVKTHFPIFLDAMRHSPFNSMDTCLAVNECRLGPVEVAQPLVPVEYGTLEREFELFFATLDEGRTVF